MTDVTIPLDVLMTMFDNKDLVWELNAKSVRLDWIFRHRDDEALVSLKVAVNERLRKLSALDEADAKVAKNDLKVYGDLKTVLDALSEYHRQKDEEEKQKEEAAKRKAELETILAKKKEEETLAMSIEALEAEIAKLED